MFCMLLLSKQKIILKIIRHNFTDYNLIIIVENAFIIKEQILTHPPLSPSLPLPFPLPLLPLLPLS